MNVHEILNYVEFPSLDIAATKKFFSSAFNWEFVNYGPDYTAFAGRGLDGGFFKSDQCSQTSNGAALLVFYSSDIAATQANVERAGGTILKPLYSFPGGQRFHFTEPGGNEFAVWTDPD